MAVRRRGKAGLLLTGFEEIDETLEQIRTKFANQIARSTMLAGARVYAKHIKRAVPPGQPEMKAAIGHSVKMAKSGHFKGKTVAKAGASVGKKGTHVDRPRRKGRPGVGIGVRNIHWWLLGTGPRRHKTTGHPTGRMPKGKPEFVKIGSATAASEAMQAMRSKAKQRLDATLKKIKAEGSPF